MNYYSTNFRIVNSSPIWKTCDICHQKIIKEHIAIINDLEANSIFICKNCLLRMAEKIDDLKNTKDEIIIDWYKYIKSDICHAKPNDRDWILCNCADITNLYVKDNQNKNRCKKCLAILQKGDWR